MTTQPPDTQWYWCFDHERAEPGAQACRADERLGPYPSKAEAENWRTKVEARNEEWDAEDRKWEGDE